MTLLDASVIIDALRSKDWSLLATMKALDGAVCGVTRAEVLAGNRGAGDQAKLVALLDEFHQVAIQDSLWDEVGDARANLRRRGVTVPLTDVVLIVIALSLDCDLWARDAHFTAMQQWFPKLRLHSEHANP